VVDLGSVTRTPRRSPPGRAPSGGPARADGGLSRSRRPL